MLREDVQIDHGKSIPSSGLHETIFPPVRPALLVRAARHYEGAEQILIRQAVMTARHFVSTQPVELPAPGQWVVTECPARVDFSGEFLGLGMGILLRVRLAGSVTTLLNCTRGLE
jgi:hypothetical protein